MVEAVLGALLLCSPLALAFPTVVKEYGRWKYRRCLANIARLERALGIDDATLLGARDPLDELSFEPGALWRVNDPAQITYGAAFATGLKRGFEETLFFGAAGIARSADSLEEGKRLADEALRRAITRAR